MELTIKINKFITHVAKTNNKVAPDKFIKINNQSIYNGALSRFTRATVVNNLHSYIINSIRLSAVNADLSLSTMKFIKPVALEFTFKTVVNHGNISLRNGRLIYKKAANNYKPNWDIENLATIWIKCITDCLVKEGILADDNVSCVFKISYTFEEVEDIDDREIIVKIKEI